MHLPPPALPSLRSAGVALPLLLGSLLAATAPDPAQLEGRWSGQIRHESNVTAITFEFQRLPDARLAARLWLSDINAYGTPVGFAVVKDGQLVVPEANLSLVLADGTLSGSLFSSDITFSVRHTSASLPAEPEPPLVAQGPAPAWTYRAGGAFWGTPVVADGVVFVGDAAGTLHAVDAATGRARWTCAAGAPLFGSATVAGDAVWLLSDAGRLQQLSRADGRVLRTVELGGGGERAVPKLNATDWDSTGAAPVVAGDTVYVGSGDGVFHALAAATGESRWTFKTGGRIRAAALVAGDLVVVGSADHFVYALERAGGAVRWKFDTGSPVTSAPMLAKGRIVIGTRDRALLYGLDAATGARQWAVDYWFSWVESTPVLADGILYAGASDSRRVRAIDPDTGRVLWAAQVWGWTWGTPVVVGDTVYYGTAGAPKYFITQRVSIGALDRRTGALQWRRSLPLLDTGYVAGIAGSLAYADGRLFAAGTDGTLTAYEVR